MGVPDFFEGKCPSCGAGFSAQSKLFGRTMRAYMPEDRIDGPDMALCLKTPCESCGGDIVAVIQGGRLTAFRSDGATVWEGPWGASFGSKEEREEVARRAEELIRKAMSTFPETEKVIKPSSE